jgi:glycosyltransferase involved in cell wall biosynthesis
VAPRTLVLPPPVERASAPAPDAPEAIAYAANPDKRGLDVLCEAWAAARPDGARLLVGGIAREAAVAWLRRRGTREPAGVEWAGAVERERWLALVAGARVFVSAARFEDWGLAQMEALAAGTPLVTAPTPGPNAALPLARALAPSLVAGSRDEGALAAALRAGLAMEADDRSAYAAAAGRLLAPYGEEALRAVVARDLLPALLTRSA